MGRPLKQKIVSQLQLKSGEKLFKQVGWNRYSTQAEANLPFVILGTEEDMIKGSEYKVMELVDANGTTHHVLKLTSHIATTPNGNFQVSFVPVYDENNELVAYKLGENSEVQSLGGLTKDGVVEEQEQEESDSENESDGEPEEPAEEPAEEQAGEE